MTNPADQAEIVRRHLAAVAKMLLVNDIMEPAVAIVAGEPLDAAKRRGLGEFAALSDKDIVYFAFAGTAGGFAMTGIDIFMPRPPFCHAFSDCRLFLAQGTARAVILPRPGGRGHFTLLPDEIVRRDDQLKGLESDGIQRAARRLRALARNGCDVTGQVIVEGWTEAA